MKVVLFCEQLIEEDYLTQVFESFSYLYPDSLVLTYLFDPAKAFGTFIQRPIRASYLSHFIKSKVALEDKSFLVPMAAKNLDIPIDADVVISFATLYPPALNLGKKTKHISYVFGHERLINKEKSLGFIEKIFKSYLKNYQKKSIKNLDHLYVGSQELQSSLQINSDDKTTVLYPFFKAQDFLPLNIVNDELKKKYVMVHIGDSTPHSFSSLFSHLDSLGFDVELISRKSSDMSNIETDNVRLVTTSCPKKLSEIFSQAEILMDFSFEFFPKVIMSAYATGTPVIYLDHSMNQEYFGNNDHYQIPCSLFYQNKWEEMNSIIERVLLSDEEKIPGVSLRQKVMKYNEIRFKKVIYKKVMELTQDSLN